MACRGCVNLQCSCSTALSGTTTTVGNGTQYAPYTFRPNYIPTLRPFGHLLGQSTQSVDGTAYNQFYVMSPDIDQGGNMNTGNRTSLTVTADGIYLVGISVPFVSVNTDNLNDNFSIRKNGTVFMSTGSYAHNSVSGGGNTEFMSTTTLLDLNTGDTLDMYVERVAGAGSVSVDVSGSLWAVWVGGPI